MKWNSKQKAVAVAGLVTPALLILIGSRITRMRRHDKTNNSSTNKPSYKPYQNLKAFLLMIQYSEGTIGMNAYRMLYGGQLFGDMRWHPNIAITKSGITSTAAGAYQILYRTWMSVQQTLPLSDFSPASQDRAAVELIRRRGALEDVLAGRFATAVYKCRKEWASLPGAGYGQGERSYASLESMYRKAGGYLMAA